MSHGRMNDLLARGLNRWIWLDDLFLRLRKRNFSFRHSIS